MLSGHNNSIDITITNIEGCDSFLSSNGRGYKCTFDVHCQLFHIRNHGDDNDDHAGIHSKSHSSYPSSFRRRADSVCGEDFGQIIFHSENIDKKTWTVSEESSSFHFSLEQNSKHADGNNNKGFLMLTIELRRHFDVSDEGGKEDYDCDDALIHGSIPIVIDKSENDSVQWVDLVYKEQNEFLGRIALAILVQTKNEKLFYNDGRDDVNQMCLDISDCSDSARTYSTSNSNYARECAVNMDFCLTIKLQKVHNILRQEHHHQMVSCQWISYEFLGNIVQSEKFNPSLLSSFVSKEDVFQLNFTSPSDLVSFLKRNTINIYMCKEGMVVGRAEINLFSSLCCHRDRSIIQSCHQSFAEGWIAIQCGSIDDDLPKISRELSPDNILQNVPQIEMSFSLSEGSLRTDLAVGEINEGIVPITFNDYGCGTEYDIDICPVQQAQLLKKAKIIAKAEIDLDKKRRKEFRQREEMKFNEHLRKKEAAVRRHLEEQVKSHESQQIKAIQSCRNEYNILESRLKSALSDVEAKEREMKRILAANNTTFIQKVSELDLKEKLVREQAQHIVDMEKAKSKGIIERIKVLESAAEAAKNRALRAEEAMQNSNEAKIAQELNTLKNQMEEMKNKIKSQNSERNELILQRDQYRKAAHKLARMVRQEKERHESSSEKRKVGREIDELHRIQKELHNLTITEEKI